MKTNCSDWGRSWGLGPTNHIGKLEKLEDGTFVWKGHRQGRHGQIWCKTYKVPFRLENGSPVFLSEKTDLPQWDDVLEAIRILETPKPVKKVRKNLTKANQLTIFES